MKWNHVKSCEQVFNAHLHCLLRRWSCWLINFVVEKPKQIWTSSKAASQVCSIHVQYSTATSRNLLVYLLVLAAAVVVWIGRGNPRQFKVLLRLSQDWHFLLRYSGICQHGFKLVLAQRMQEAFTKGRIMLYPIYPLTTLVAAFPLNDARWWNNAVVDKLGLNAKISASLVSCKKCLEGISVIIGMRTVLVGACNLVFSSPQKNAMASRCHAVEWVLNDVECKIISFRVRSLANPSRGLLAFYLLPLTRFFSWIYVHQALFCVRSVSTEANRKSTDFKWMSSAKCYQYLQSCMWRNGTCAAHVKAMSYPATREGILKVSGILRFESPGRQHRGYDPKLCNHPSDSP